MKKVIFLAISLAGAMVQANLCQIEVDSINGNGQATYSLLKISSSGDYHLYKSQLNVHEIETEIKHLQENSFCSEVIRHQQECSINLDTHIDLSDSLELAYKLQISSAIKKSVVKTPQPDTLIKVNQLVQKLGSSCGRVVLPQRGSSCSVEIGTLNSPNRTILSNLVLKLKVVSGSTTSVIDTNSIEKAQAAQALLVQNNHCEMKDFFRDEVCYSKWFKTRHIGAYNILQENLVSKVYTNSKEYLLERRHLQGAHVDTDTSIIASPTLARIGALGLKELGVCSKTRNEDLLPYENYFKVPPFVNFESGGEFGEMNFRFYVSHKPYPGGEIFVTDNYTIEEVLYLKDHGIYFMPGLPFRQDNPDCKIEAKTPGDSPAKQRGYVALMLNGNFLLYAKNLEDVRTRVKQIEKLFINPVNCSVY